MSEPQVVGIPVGGAVTDQHRRAAADTTQRQAHTADGSATCGAQTLSNDHAAAKSDGADVRGLSRDAHQPTAAHTLPSDRLSAKRPAADQNACVPSASRPSAPRPDINAPEFSQRAPVFHLIAEPSESAPAPEPTAFGSHVEVGVRGRARQVTRAELREARVADAKVRQPGRALGFAAVAAVVVGSGFLVRALTLADPVPPPVPPAWAGRAVGAVGHRAAPMGYAQPTRVSIARVGIHADVLATGLARDGAVGVPPAREPLTAAWYDRGPAPGQAGPAVITGHVDSRFAPGNRAAFYELGDVRPGDDVDVARADRRVAVFRVDSVALVPKTGFPTQEVYGPTGYAALRLITCGGHYDRRTGYADNVIVYAHLIGSR
jgi:hypothetical protein